VTWRPRTALAAGLLLVAGALSGCSTTSGGAGGTSYVAGDGTIVLVPAAKRQQPVTLRGSTLEGAPFDLETLRGRTVVVNVWGSWCPPCRKEAPDLQAASVALAAKGVSFVGINTRDEDPAQAIAFQKTFAITYPSVTDDGGRILLGLRCAVPPNAIPSTLVIDPQGRIAARISATTTRTTLVDLVDDVLAGKDTV